MTGNHAMETKMALLQRFNALLDAHLSQSIALLGRMTTATDVARDVGLLFWWRIYQLIRIRSFGVVAWRR